MNEIKYIKVGKNKKVILPDENNYMFKRTIEYLENMEYYSAEDDIENFLSDGGHEI